MIPAPQPSTGKRVTFWADAVFAKPEIYDALEGLASRALLGRSSTPQDIVGLAVFLASDDSNYITGQSIMVDGGLVLL